MTDIGLQYNNDIGEADWIIAGGDLVAGDDLETAILVSVFTDARATADFTLWDGTNDRRGWWGNSYEPTEIGSNLWQLDRAKITDSYGLLAKARDYCKTALQWMIDTGVAAKISVVPSLIGKQGLSIQIVVTKPVTNEKRTFRYAVYWQQVGL